MVREVIDRGWLRGSLKPAAKVKKPRPDIKAVRAARVREQIKKWETRLKRAETMLRKLNEQDRYYAKLGI